MPRKPAEVVTETYKVVSIAVHPAETHGGVLLMVEGQDTGLVVDNAKFYVPGNKKVNLWKLIQWLTTSKGVTVEVDKLVKKDRVKEARFSVEGQTEKTKGEESEPEEKVDETV